MHGFQSYPTLVEDANLNKMVLLHQTYGLPVGFADHIDGDHMVRYDLCALAMGLGARLIEKHITVDIVILERMLDQLLGRFILSQKIHEVMIP